MMDKINQSLCVHSLDCLTQLKAFENHVKQLVFFLNWKAVKAFKVTYMNWPRKADFFPKHLTTHLRFMHFHTNLKCIVVKGLYHNTPTVAI